jgi:WbqC-like protein family
VSDTSDAGVSLEDGVDPSGLERPAVALMQPTFLPWAGYFALLDECDSFVFLDDFQFSRRSFHHRNRLFSARGRVQWVTVPVQHRGTQSVSIIDSRPMMDQGFIRSFSRLLQTAYGSSDWFDHVGPTLTESIRSGHRSLADLNIDLIHRICGLLCLEHRTLRSSEIETTGVRSTRIANLLRNVGARTYLAAPGSAAYMAADDVFPLPDVATLFQSYVPEPYPQRHAEEFVPRLSVVDALFQVGPERALEVVRTGARGFTAWSRMMALPAGRGRE